MIRKLRGDCKSNRSVVGSRTMSDQTKTIVEFIPVDQLPRNQVDVEETERVYKDEQPYSEVATELKELTRVAQSDGELSRVRVPRDVSRKRLVQAFTDAFELIGGVPRLAHWADQHPSEFYKLMARLFPNVAQQQIEHGGQVTVIHALPRSKLDE